MRERNRIHSLSFRVRATCLGLLLAPGLVFCQPAHSQGVSPALDLDRSGEIDSNDVFLFASIWLEMYDIGARNFNIEDFFPMAGGNTWHYTAGIGEPTDENFAFVIEQQFEPLPSGFDAFRIRNDYDAGRGDRQGVTDLWRYDDSGNLFYEGFLSDVTLTLGLGIEVPPQVVYFSDPLPFGIRDQEVGQILQGTATSTIEVNVNDQPMELVFEATGELQATGFLQTFATDLGEFTDVLRVRFNVTIGLTMGDEVFEFDFFNNTVFFKEGIGPIAIDLSPDVNNNGALTIDMGTIFVDGSPVEITAQ
ncbi:MAG: hypothetical protein H6751_06995 [Candidatus Omnitrophica bacterium]|nr:hypothetical protein [Candidatus Omnitrophota bacterium]